MESDTVTQFRSLCPVATGLDVFGDNWTLLILRDMLFLHKSTFNEFKNAPELMPSKMLSNRLKKLEALGFIRRKKGEVNKKNVHYLLEEKGMETFPIMVEIALFTTDFFYDHLGDTYTEVADWNAKATDLASRFIKNFAQYTDNQEGQSLVKAGPQI